MRYFEIEFAYGEDKNYAPAATCCMLAETTPTYEGTEEFSENMMISFITVNLIMKEYQVLKKLLMDTLTVVSTCGVKMNSLFMVEINF